VLLALGLAIIFGMIGVLNLAQEEFLTLGAYTVLYLRPVTQVTERSAGIRDNDRHCSLKHQAGGDRR